MKCKTDLPCKVLLLNLQKLRIKKKYIPSLRYFKNVKVKVLVRLSEAKRIPCSRSGTRGAKQNVSRAPEAEHRTPENLRFSVIPKRNSGSELGRKNIYHALRYIKNNHE